MTPAIEAFGFHRILFGSFSALPEDHIKRRTRPSVDLIYPHHPSAWYATLRRCLTELGTDEKDLGAVMGDNALKVYRLENSSPVLASQRE